MTSWIKHPHYDAYELQVGEYRARVKFIWAYGAEYMWAVLKCSTNHPPFAELSPQQYVEILAGDTIGEGALEQAQQCAETALEALVANQLDKDPFFPIKRQETPPSLWDRLKRWFT